MSQKEKKETTVCNSWKWSDKEVSGTVEEIECLEDRPAKSEKPAKKRMR